MGQICMGNKIYKGIAIVLLSAILIGAGFVLLPWPLGSAAGPTEFRIEKGQGLGETARLLAQKNLINDRLVFVAFAVLTGQEKKFKAGRYLIPPSVSISTLVDMFSRGLSESDDIAVTIPEGTNLADIDEIFAKVGLIQKSDLLGPNFLKDEGYLFPDTYKFSREDLDNGTLHATDIIQKLNENFNQKTGGLFKNLNSQDIKKVLIIASLLEKEAKTNDMRLVSGIIQKRLNKGMLLQLDATVAYGVCYPKFLLKQYCNTALSDIIDNLGLDSAYNTYRNIGLPPTPISNPGLDAIEAALNPQSSDYLYYLNTRNGTTIFSKTAAEHEAARRKYLVR